MKSFFDCSQKAKPKKSKPTNKPETFFEVQPKESKTYCKAYCNLSMVGINYCKEIDDNVIHLMTENQLETKCNKVFKEGCIYPAWSTDIRTLTSKCPSCFKSKYKRRKR